jgi:hypothetical protein
MINKVHNQIFSNFRMVKLSMFNVYTWASTDVFKSLLGKYKVH